MTAIIIISAVLIGGYAIYSVIDILRIRKIIFKKISKHEN